MIFGGREYTDMCSVYSADTLVKKLEAGTFRYLLRYWSLVHRKPYLRVVKCRRRKKEEHTLEVTGMELNSHGHEYDDAYFVTVSVNRWNRSPTRQDESLVTDV